MKMTLYLLGCTLVAALGGLLFGFDTAVISGTTDWLRKEFGLSEFTLGFTVASALIGTIVGSIAVGPAGRRDRAAGDTLHHGGLLCGVGNRLRACVGLVVVHGLPFSRRAGGGRRVGGFADVHRRDLAGPLPRAARGRHAIQYRVGHLAGLPLELRHRRACTSGKTSAGGCSV